MDEKEGDSGKSLEQKIAAIRSKCSLVHNALARGRSSESHDNCGKCGREMDYAAVKFRYYIHYPSEDDMIEIAQVPYCPCCDKKPGEHGPEIDIGDKWNGH